MAAAERRLEHRILQVGFITLKIREGADTRLTARP